MESEQYFRIRAPGKEAAYLRSAASGSRARLDSRVTCTSQSGGPCSFEDLEEIMGPLSRRMIVYKHFAHSFRAFMCSLSQPHPWGLPSRCSLASG